MRAIVFYIYLSFLLLCVANHLHAATHHSPTTVSFTHKIEKKQQVKHKNSRHQNVLKESADIEVDEEFHTSDGHNHNGASKLLAERQSLLDSWYLSFSHGFLFKDSSTIFKIFAPFSVYSNPIYLRIGVFRI